MQVLGIDHLAIRVADLARSKRFYVDGFGWTPVFENEEVVFYQMNGFVLGTWLTSALEKDTNTSGLPQRGAFSIAHNVGAKDEVAPLIDKLASAGGTVLREADAPLHGGFRGYVADPDEHAWEIAWNPAFTIDPQGHVTFGV